MNPLELIEDIFNILSEREDLTFGTTEVTLIQAAACIRSLHLDNVAHLELIETLKNKLIGLTGNNVAELIAAHKQIEELKQELKSWVDAAANPHY